MENENLTNRGQWQRILYMMLFACVLYIVMSLVCLVAVVQVIFSLFSGKPNEDIQSFSADLTAYIRQIVAFLLYVDECKPFPFTDSKTSDS